MTTTETIERDVYVDAVPVIDMFIDPTYQRPCDPKRAERMGKGWQRRLVGVLDVSDRGEHASPRYAIVNGQHRWAAAIHAGTITHLPANVHTGLTVTDEAALFRDIDRTTSKLTTADRWRSRRAARDPLVLAIEELATGFGLKVEQRVGYFVCCFSTLEACARRDPVHLARVFEIVTDVWPQDPASLKSGIIKALWAISLSELCDSGRLADVLETLTPTQIHARSVDIGKTWTGQHWSHEVRAIIDAYNRTRGAKVDVEAIINGAR